MAEGLLLTMMTPGEGGDADFNDWVNREHIPERRKLPGFRRTRRFRNTHASPRYLALYDLDDVAVLRSDAYRAISGDNLSTWSKRVVAIASDRWRFSGSCISTEGDDGPVRELLLLRWRSVADRCDGAIRASAALAAGGLARSRVFVGEGKDPIDYVAIVEAAGAIGQDARDPGRYATAAAICDFAQIFVPIEEPG